MTTRFADHLLAGTHASRPGAGTVPTGTLYACSTHGLIYQSDGSATWSTWSDATAAGVVASDPIWDAAGDLAVGTGADAAARLALGTAAYGLVSDGSTAAWAEVLPWHVSILPQVWTPDASTGVWALQAFTDVGIVYPLYQPGSTANSGGAVAWISAGNLNDACAWDVVLAKGTWDAHFWVRKVSNAGIITLQQDGSNMGTVDTYAAAVAAAKVSITGWSVAATGKKRMNVLMATKNGSSAAYFAELFAVEFRRTA